MKQGMAKQSALSFRVKQAQLERVAEQQDRRIEVAFVPFPKRHA